MKSNFSLIMRYKSLEYLQELNKGFIESFIIHAKIDKQWSPKTIKNSLCYINLFLKWCVNEKLLDENPAENIVRPKVPKRALKGLSAEDATRLIEYAKNMPTIYKFCQIRGVAAIAIFLYT